MDRAIKEAFASVDVYSNDVSLLSCAIGELAAGRQVDMRFTGELAWVEDIVATMSPQCRVAAIQLVLQLATYRGDNLFARGVNKHLRDRFDSMLAKTERMLTEFVDGMIIKDFYPGDFREQAKRAQENGGGVAAFPPTYKGGYESIYRYLESNTDWAKPPYSIWDPALIGDWIAGLQRSGVRYCVLTDHLIDGLEPRTQFEGPGRPVYTYCDDGRSSLRRAPKKSTPFRYEPVDCASLRPDSQVTILAATNGQMNFLKDRYLARGIRHTPGMANFLVMIDGKLAGGIIFGLSAGVFYVKRGDGEQHIFMLCDFAITREQRISKLIVMLAAGQALIGRLESRMVQRFDGVSTTVYTDKPVSMKYRGVYELAGRRNGELNYVSKVRRQTCDEIYADWWERYGSPDGNPAHAARLAAAAGKKRALHERRSVQQAGGEPEAGRRDDQPSARAAGR